MCTQKSRSTKLETAHGKSDLRDKSTKTHCHISCSGTQNLGYSALHDENQALKKGNSKILVHEARRCLKLVLRRYQAEECISAALLKFRTGLLRRHLHPSIIQNPKHSSKDAS